MLVDEQYFSASKNLVKSRAFLPAPYQDGYSMSTFDVDGLSRDSIWELGHTNVACPETRRDMTMPNCARLTCWVWA